MSVGVNKHTVLREWVQEFLGDRYLYFESADAYPNVRIAVPQYGDYVLRTDILGNKYKQYSFVFVGYEQLDVGTSDINATNMLLFDEFSEWVEEQQKQGNFPNFGENTDEYQLNVVQNMANLSFVTDDGIAKYMLAVNINYRELEVN